MATDNIIIRISAESDLSAANEDLQSLQDRERDIQMEMRKQASEYQKQVALIGQTVKGREQQVAALDKLSASQAKQQASLDTELKKTKANLDQFARSMSNVNDTVAKGAVKTPQLRTELMMVKEELARMEQAGNGSSNAFVNLSIKAGKLQDQMGDTRQRIQILSSDTKGLDAAMGVGQGLAGGFTAATSAAALLGGENEQLQKAFFKVQAVMQILNGVNMVAIALNKDQAARVVIGTALNKVFNKTKEEETIAHIANTGATVTETFATRALGIAMKAIPFVAIAAAVIAIVVAVRTWITASEDAESQAIKEKAAQDNLEASYNKTKVAIDAQATIDKARHKDKLHDIAIELQAENDKWDQTEAIELKYLKIKKDSGIELTKEQTERLSALEELEKTHNETVLKLNSDFNTQIELDKITASDKAISDEKLRLIKAAEERAKQQEKDAEIQKKKREELNKFLYDSDVQRMRQEQKNLNFITTAFVKKEEEKKVVKADAIAKFIEDDKKALESVREKTAEEIRILNEKEQQKQQIIQQSGQLIGEIGNGIFNAQKDRLGVQLTDLDQYYTTDAEAAKNNSKLKLITEEQLAAKKLEIKIKQAKIDKEQALFNIALSTAEGIAANLKTPALIPFIIALGLTEAITAAAVPLPKYAKGLKGGSKGGHFATVGELGAETMWIPDNAAVIPHNRQLNFDTFNDFGIPSIGLDSSFMRSDIDYNKLGKAVADNVRIPSPKPVTVNIDKNGITTKDGSSTVTYLNKKYSTTWN